MYKFSFERRFSLAFWLLVVLVVLFVKSLAFYTYICMYIRATKFIPVPVRCNAMQFTELECVQRTGWMNVSMVKNFQAKNIENRMEKKKLKRRVSELERKRAKISK